MKFDDYWRQLVHRVHHGHEKLTGAEERVYRLTCIMGETMVDGLEAYFERRWQEYDEDQRALREAGFAAVADDYAAARAVLFGEHALSAEYVEGVIDRILEDTADVLPIQEELNVIGDRLIARNADVYQYRYQLGLQHGLYEDDGA